jgi:hypothetical protein
MFRLNMGSPASFTHPAPASYWSMAKPIGSDTARLHFQISRLPELPAKESARWSLLRWEVQPAVSPGLAGSAGPLNNQFRLEAW